VGVELLEECFVHVLPRSFQEERYRTGGVRSLGEAADRRDEDGVRDGVTYSVPQEDGSEEVELWREFVPFGRRRTHKAGGKAFREAAKRQEREAAGIRKELTELQDAMGRRIREGPS